MQPFQERLRCTGIIKVELVPRQSAPFCGIVMIARGGSWRSESIGMSDRNESERAIGMNWNRRSESIGMGDRIRSEYA